MTDYCDHSRLGQSCESLFLFLAVDRLINECADLLAEAVTVESCFHTLGFESDVAPAGWTGEHAINLLDSLGHRVVQQFLAPLTISLCPLLSGTNGITEIR